MILLFVYITYVLPIVFDVIFTKVFECLFYFDVIFT